MNTVHERFRHKLNYFLFYPIFEKLFITCVKVLIIFRRLNFEGFDCQV
jgi:Na+/glutamate symporter